VPYLSASAVVIHYEEALYQVYATLCTFYNIRPGNGAGGLFFQPRSPHGAGGMTTKLLRHGSISPPPAYQHSTLNL